MIIGLALGSSLVGAAILVGLSRHVQTSAVIINLDRGLLDCPWPSTASDPNGPSLLSGPDSQADPSGMMRPNVRLTLQDTEQTFFSVPAQELHCYRSNSLGPALDIWLSIEGGDGPLPTKRRPAFSIDDPSGTTHARLYRLGLKLLADFHVTDPVPFGFLEDFYLTQSARVWLHVGSVGHSAMVDIDLEAGFWTPLARLLVQFASTGPEDHVCSLADAAGPLPPCPAGHTWRDSFRTSGTERPKAGADSTDPALSAGHEHE